MNRGAGERLAVIVPTLNEEAELPATLVAVHRSLPGAKLIVADGGSRDGTVARAQQCGAQVVISPRGRGAQLAAGAAAASREWMLFLHADTRLPPEAGAALLQYWSRNLAPVATFRLGFDEAGWFLRACARVARIDSVFSRFGDQGIVISRKAYLELGGFPPWPLFEDVELLRCARRRYGRVEFLPAVVITSARRFRAHGAWRQQTLNAGLLCAFLAGVSPHRLASVYENCRPLQRAARAS